MSRSRSRAAVVSALSVIAAGTLVVAVPAGADAAAAPAATVKVSIAKNRAITMPGTLRPGVHRFVISSKRGSSFQLAKPRKGYTKAELAHDVNASLNSGKPSMKALKRFERNVVMVGGVSSEPGAAAVMWANLTRGTYFAVDTNNTAQKARRIRTVRVLGHRIPGKLPHGATIKATHAVDWAPNPKAIPHKGLLTFRNASSDNHFVSLSRLSEGKTFADFQAWMEASMQGGGSAMPPVEMTGGLDSGIVSPKKAMTMRYDLPAGAYVLICWWPDADMGGMPHAFMGMYRGLTLK